MYRLNALLLVYILLRWSGDCVLLKQLEPPNGTSACPGDKIKLVCESTFQNEATLTWQVIGGNCSSGFWGNLKKASKGTLMLPNGDNGTWEVETLDDTTKTFTLSLTINASLDLHNVTIACCSEHSPSLCSDSAAIPNEYKGIAVINISADSKCGNTSEHYSSEQDATQPKDQALQYNLVWGVVSIISLIVCGLDFIIQLITFRCSTPDKKMKFWVLIILFSATLFASINVIQIPIYQFEKAKTEGCTVVGSIFQMDLIFTIVVTIVLSLYLCAKLCNKSEVFNLTQLVQHLSLLPKHIIPAIIAVIAVGIAMGTIIAPFVSGNYGDAGGWCWIKLDENKNNAWGLNTNPCTAFAAGISCQIITSSLGLIAALVCIVLAITEFCKHKKDYNDKYLLATVMCFLVSFFVGNCVSLINRTTLAYGTPNRGFMFFHSTVNPLWPLLTALPTIIQSIRKIRTVEKQQFL